MDEPLVEYQGTGTSSRTFLIADERGSIVAGTNNSGARAYINRYDEYGKPQSGNQGRFQYTGQVYLSDAKLYHYKARVYDPELGRFLQTDPIGYAAGMNLYAYVGNDPMNLNDPTGLDEMEWRRGRQMWEPMLLHGWHRDIPIAPPRQTYPIRRTDTDTIPQLPPFGIEYNQAVAAANAPLVTLDDALDVLTNRSTLEVRSGAFVAFTIDTRIISIGVDLDAGSLRKDMLTGGRRVTTGVSGGFQLFGFGIEGGAFERSIAIGYFAPGCLYCEPSVSEIRLVSPIPSRGSDVRLGGRHGMLSGGLGVGAAAGSDFIGAGIHISNNALARAYYNFINAQFRRGATN